MDESDIKLLFVDLHYTKKGIYWLVSDLWRRPLKYFAFDNMFKTLWKEELAISSNFSYSQYNFKVVSMLSIIIYHIVQIVNSFPQTL